MVTKPEWDGFYTLAEIARITGIPRPTLSEWRMRGVIAPSIVVTDGAQTEEGYTYADLTIIRLIRALRGQHLDFGAAARALRHMYDRLGPPNRGWRDQRVYFSGNKIYVEGQDDWPVTEATHLGQTVAVELFGTLFDDLRDAEDSILVPQEFRLYVQIDPSVMGGEPVIRDTRIPTRVIAELRAKGRSVVRLAELYYPLRRVFLEKAIAYERFLDKQAAIGYSPRSTAASTA